MLRCAWQLEAARTERGELAKEVASGKASEAVATSRVVELEGYVQGLLGMMADNATVCMTVSHNLYQYEILISVGTFLIDFSLACLVWAKEDIFIRSRWERRKKLLPGRASSINPSV